MASDRIVLLVKDSLNGIIVRSIDVGLEYDVNMWKKSSKRYWSVQMMRGLQVKRIRRKHILCPPIKVGVKNLGDFQKRVSTNLAADFASSHTLKQSTTFKQ